MIAPHIPKVSVIVPVYGVETFIERCARSLFGQTLDDIEYLFINDCTPDNSIEILKSVLNEYPNRKSQVFIHQMEKNSGQAVVRQWGMQHATGEYIIHCDSDDWVHKDMYQAMYEKAVSEDADFVVCNYCESNGKDINKKKKGSHTEDAKAFFENIIYQTDQWSLWNKLFRRSLLKEDLIYPKYAMGEDYVLCLQLVWNSHSMAYIDETYYYYYINEQSLTKSVSIETIEKRFHQSVGNAEEILRFLNEKGLYERYKDAIDCVLLNKKNILLPLIGIRKYCKIWYKTFPELNFRMLLNKRLSFNSKVKHLIALSPFRKFYYHYEG